MGLRALRSGDEAANRTQHSVVHSTLDVLHALEECHIFIRQRADLEEEIDVMGRRRNLPEIVESSVKEYSIGRPLLNIGLPIDSHHVRSWATFNQQWLLDLQQIFSTPSGRLSHAADLPSDYQIYYRKIINERISAN
ncbi:hypothetical protein EVAR_2421_1 [Eumeta japonica]|uniref:Uncharacterized protein n=1 Tax=Eumeta variegata TaxID=151549 RepID=A0A4C1SNX9_EUMVA|nr:hypothetical protein EVAR_2421_1 [Eumeta japonica]